MSSRKRGSHAIEERAVVVDGEEAVVDPSVKTLFEVLTESTYKANTFQATPKEIANYHAISADAQAQCIKSVVRLLIMKGM